MAKQTRRRTTAPVVFPIPEAVTDRAGDWAVRQAKRGETPHVAFGRGSDAVHRMAVPVSSSAHDHRVRMHEMAHARWTPQRMKFDSSIPEEYVNACEDARINALSYRAGLGETLGVPILQVADPEEFQSRMVNAFGENPGGLASFLVAAIGTADESIIRTAVDAHPMAETIDKAARGAVRRATKKRGRTVPFSSTVRAAEYLADIFGRIDPETGERVGGEAMGDPDVADDVLEMMETADKREDRYGSGPRGSGGGAPVWAEPTIETPALTRPLPVAMRKIRSVYRKSGSAVKAMHRFATDGAIFGRSAAGKGGAVLVDISGSMRLDGDDVAKILAGMPAGIIAVYEGVDASENWSRLAIVARNGRRCADEHLAPRFGGNACDLPALEWLGKQEGPRYWVSDGHVIPGGGGDYAAAYRECAAAMARLGIRRIDSADAMVGVLTDADDK